MENRTIFALDGITGMIVATLLLLGIEGTLVFFAIGAQGSASQEYYYIDDVKSVKMFGSKTQDHIKLYESVKKDK